MVYLINHMIIFNEEEATIAWIDRENEPVSLSAPISRLLSTLIVNPGITISREVLLREALEKYSLSPSLNNLNNYISLLRKVLREFGIADSLVTIPKSGIVFNVESIETFQKEKKSAHSTPDIRRDPVVSRVPALTSGKSSPLLPRQKIRQIVEIFLIIGAILITLFMAFTHSHRFPERPLLKINLSGKCDIYFMEENIDRDTFGNYEELCSDNILFLLPKKEFVPGLLTKKSQIIISCSRDGKGCVTYVNH